MLRSDGDGFGECSEGIGNCQCHRRDPTCLVEDCCCFIPGFTVFDPHADDDLRTLEERKIPGLLELSAPQLASIRSDREPLSYNQ